MKVLVTGGGGFIGAWVIAALLGRGVATRVMEIHDDRSLLAAVVGDRHSDVEWVCGDTSRLDELRGGVDGCDAVIHLAGALGPLCETNPARGAEINLIATLHLLTLASERALPLSYASTALVYGSEDTGPPNSHYGTFKLASEHSARVFFRERKVSSVGIRPPVVYGFGRTQGNSAGPSLACAAAAAGQEYVIPMTGALDLIYVEDVAAAFVASVLQPIEGAIVANLHGHVTTVESFIDAVRDVVPDAKVRAAGKSHPINTTRKGHAIDEFFPALPHTSLREGIRATVRHHQSRA